MTSETGPRGAERSDELARESRKDQLKDGARKWVSGTYGGHNFPLRLNDHHGHPVTVMGPAYPGGPGGVDPDQLYVIPDDGERYVTLASTLFPAERSPCDPSLFDSSGNRTAWPRETWYDRFLREQERLEKSGFPKALERLQDAKARLKSLRKVGRAESRRALREFRKADRQLRLLQQQLFPNPVRWDYATSPHDESNPQPEEPKTGPNQPRAANA